MYRILGNLGEFAMFGILFVCHGNICRSTMAESMLEDRIVRGGAEDELFVSSAATHSDAIGCPPHHGTREKLRQMGIPLKAHSARLLTKEDGEKYDLILGMDEENRTYMHRILGKAYENKIALLLDFTPYPRAIADPWYTGNFDATFCDLVMGLDALIAELVRRKVLRKPI